MLQEIYGRISPRLAHRPGSGLFSRAHARLMIRSRGRIARRFLGADVLVLRTIGRRSGQLRQAPVMFVAEAGGFAIVAANAASKLPPAWWLNLQAHPDADVFVDGRWIRVRARPATAEEEQRLWPRFREMYWGYEHYRQLATRELPVVLLEPTGAS